MAINCPKCKAELSEDSHFCSKCGTAIKPGDAVSVSQTKTIKTPGISRDKTIAGKYKIIEEIGRGGMGVVYKAEDTKLKRNVALKFLPAELTVDDEAKKRFVQEAQAAAALNHPHICTIYEIDETKEQTFISMEYVDGLTLKDKLVSGPLSIDEATDIVIQVAQGLEKAHKKGILHRDIKPANIMINDEGQAKIMDFGLAKLSWGVDLTKTSTIMGTVAYMSPEQARAEEVDHRTDIWSLGAMLYEMLTGERPFAKEHEQALIFSILNDEPKPISSFRSDVPNSVESAIYKALEKSPSKRHQNVQEFINALKEKPQISTSKSEKSIAVLPFTNMSADPEQEYFCDGMTEEIINALTHIADLKVIARTSSFMFKGKHDDMREIGKKLDVEHLLEGSVRKAGNRIRITAQLIKVSDGSHLWSEKYDRNMEDIFDIQDEISLAIVDNLRIKLLAKEKDAVLKRNTENVEAYNMYLKALFYLYKMTGEGFAKGKEYLKQSIELDPNYALSYAGLSIHYSAGLGFWMLIPPDEAYKEAEFYARKAIEIDDKLAEAHTALANVKFYYEWDWEEAEKEYKRALDINPKSERTLFEYAVFLGWIGRADEAIDLVEKMVELDPLSFIANVMVAWSHQVAARLDEAISFWKKALEMSPDSVVSRANLSIGYAGNGMYAEAVSECKKYEPHLSEGGNLTFTATVGYCYAMAGDAEKAFEIIHLLEKLSKERYVDPYFFAIVYAGLNDKDRTFDWLEKAYANRSVMMPHLKSQAHLWFKNVSTDSRYKALLERMNLGEKKEGQYQSEDEQPEESKRRASVFKTKKLIWPVLAIIVFALAGILLWQTWTKTEQPPAISEPPSIAVLPFEDLSPQKDQEHFCLGIPQELIRRLNNVQRLFVPSHAASSLFRGEDRDIQNAGSRLNVNAILTGTLQKSGPKLRISVELINVADNQIIWQDTYEKDEGDIFNIQDEVTLQIVDMLKVNLLGEEETILVKRHTKNTEAYDLYLKGRLIYSNLHKMVDDARKALEYFEAATEIDPNYALAYLGIIDVLTYLYVSNSALPEDTWLQVDKAINKVLLLDDRLAEAYGFRATWKMIYKYDWKGAEQDFSKALELNPYVPNLWVHYWHAALFFLTSRYEEALEKIKIMQKVDPTSNTFLINKGWILIVTANAEEALQSAQEMIDINPSMLFNHLLKAQALATLGRYEEAIEPLLYFISQQGRSAWDEVGLLGYLYGRLGRTQDALEQLKKLDELPAELSFVSVFPRALVHVGLNEKNKAFELFNECYRDRNPWLTLLRTNIFNLELHSEPEFKELMSKIGLDK